MAAKFNRIRFDNKREIKKVRRLHHNTIKRCSHPETRDRLQFIYALSLSVSDTTLNKIRRISLKGNKQKKKFKIIPYMMGHYSKDLDKTIVIPEEGREERLIFIANKRRCI